jgi:hypothetical protein
MKTAMRRRLMTTLVAVGITLTAWPASMASAASGTSQNGWPANSDPAAIGVQSYTVPGTSPTVTLKVKSGDVARILIGVAARFQTSVEDINGAESAGYNYRVIAGTNTLSNHASGTAIDLNWNEHPQGTRGTFTQSQVSAIRTILNSCDGVVRWGGDYSGSGVDEMHFEINVPPGDASLDNCATRMGLVAGTASIYGALSDGRLTYTAVDAATGTRTHGAVVSSASLGFVPVAMATLNFNTILVTSSSGELFRVDVITNNTDLIFNPPVSLADHGWTHDLLAYDGNGHLFGIANGVLRRYTITATKPTAANITANTVIDSGFTLKTLTTTGADWLLGTTAGGYLISYKINGPGDWTRYNLRTSTWQVFDSLTSPGGGVYFGHKPDGSMYRYVDTNPYDGDDSDLSGAHAVDSGGWTQVLLSAQPGTVTKS